MYSILFYTAEDRLGDALIKLPAILGLHKIRPDIQLIWVTGSQASAFSRALAPLVTTAISEIHEKSRLGIYWRAAPHPLRDRHFNCVIVSDKKLRSAMLLRALPHDRFIAPAANFFFSDKKPLRPFEQSVSEQTRVLFELAIDQPVKLELELPIPLRERELAARILPAGKEYVGLAPGAGGCEKCWPLERYIEIALAQTAQNRIPVFFLGPMESFWRRTIMDRVPAARFPEYTFEGTSLGGPLLTIALAARLTVAVANDAGAGHLLAAGGRPLISLFGNTNPVKFEPPYNKRTVIRASEFGSTQVSAIPVGVVMQAIDTLCAHCDD